MIGAGREWKGEISRALEAANIILLMVSPSFVASDYCYDIEMARAMERRESGDSVVIPIILRPVDWTNTHSPNSSLSLQTRRPLPYGATVTKPFKM